MPTLVRPDIVLAQQLNLAPRVTFSFLQVFGRLKPGVSIEQARAALQPLYLECLKNVPAGFAKEVSFAVNLLRDRQVRDYRTTSLILLACVCGVLLIACANVANLLLARAVARQRELAVRAALGASRGRIARQMLTESAVLGAIGGGLGLLLAVALLQAMISLAPEGIPRLREATLDLRALLFALAATATSAILFGTAPALLSPRAEILNTARVAGSGLRLRQALVALQMGVTFVLLSGAGLLLQSLWNMQRVNLGLRSDNLLTIRVQLPQQRYGQPPRQSAFFENALASLERLPGLRAVALTDSVPLSGPSTTMIYSNIEIQGHAPPDPKRQTGGMTVFRTVTPSYFQALGIPMVRGRAFTEADRAGSEELVILDQALAARLFPGEDPLGRKFRSGMSGPFRTIVGISRSAKNSTLTAPDDPEYYFLWRKSPDFGRRRASILLRSETNPAPLMQLVRREIAQLDREIPLTMDTMEQNISRQLTRPRFEGLLLALFALAGVLLAAVGQFGVISYLVTQRSPEIGVRMALGASTGHVVGLVLRHTLNWTLFGAALGAAVSWYSGRYVESLLYGVRPTDAVALAAALVLLVVVSLAAALQPTRRAVRVDPARVLRHE
jgi:predicted permease